MPPQSLSFEKQYRIVKDIGAGSSGTVHIVADRKTNARFVMKRISLVGADDKTRARVQSEVRALSSIDHANVVQFKQSFSMFNEVCIVMEKCERSLSDALATAHKDKTVINPTVLIEWMTELLCALQYVHSKNIIHRDIKASNVFLSARNHVKLGDFGVCKHRAADESHVAGRTVIGTPHYLAPEVLDGDVYDERSDVWSLGVLFYEMCALRLPFEGNNILALTRSISAGDFQPLPSYLDQRFTTVIASMLKVNPVERTTIQQIFATRFVLPKSHPSHPSHDAEHGRAIQRECGPSVLYTSKSALLKACSAERRESAQPALHPVQQNGQQPPRNGADSSVESTPKKSEERSRPAAVSISTVQVVNSNLDETIASFSSFGDTAVSALTESGCFPCAVQNSDVSNHTTGLQPPPNRGPSDGIAGSRSLQTDNAHSKGPPHHQRSVKKPGADQLSSPAPRRPDSAKAPTTSAVALGRLSEEEHKASLNRIRNAGSKINIAQLRKAMKQNSTDNGQNLVLGDVTFIAVPASASPARADHDNGTSFECESPQPPQRHVDPTITEGAVKPSTLSVAQRVVQLLEDGREHLTVSDMDDVVEAVHSFKTRMFGLL